MIALETLNTNSFQESLPLTMPFYAVKRGIQTGVFESWAEAEPLVTGFPGAAHKSFATRAEAEAYMAIPAPRIRIFMRTADRVALQKDAFVLPASREVAKLIVALAEVGCPVTEPALRRARALASEGHETH